MDFESIPDRVAHNAQCRGGSTALVSEGRRQSWAELGERSKRIAHGLHALGCGPGSRVAILAPCSIEYVEILLGILQSGASVVPLPTLMKADTLGLMLADSDAGVLFAADSQRAVAEEALEKSGGLPEERRIAVDFTGDRWSTYEDLLAGETGSALSVSFEPEQEFNLIYSSGTTGVPKGIVQPHRLRSAQMSAAEALGMGPDAVTLISTALYSNWTLFGLFASLFGGGTTVLMPKFDAGEYLRLLGRESVTHAFLVPTQIERLLEHPNFDERGTRTEILKLSAGSPLAVEIKREVLDRWPGGLIENYGLTEGAPTTLLFAHLHPDKLDSVGQAAVGGEIRIIGEDDTELPVGQIGEVVGRTGAMMSGYHNRPDLTEALVWRDSEGRRFFRSGDVGRLDEDGFLYVLERKKDVIISGGMNIYASDIEAVIAQHEDVAEVAVIGVPSKEWGETPLALVVLKDGSTTSARAVEEWANERLGKAQRISGVEFRESLPRGALEKILKKELREPYRKGE